MLPAAPLSPISHWARAERRRAPTSSALAVGQLFHGKYLLVHRLAVSEMGEVWQARHLLLDEDVALKIPALEPDPERAATSAARFRLEAHIAASLSFETEHVVRPREYCSWGARPYLAMELLQGETLQSEIRRSGCVAPARVAEIVAQTASALEAGHRHGILHRDLKPSNVFLTTDRHGQLSVKLLDFGVALVRRGGNDRLDAVVTAVGICVGTPAYMSPEQACAAPDIDFHCDLWGMAATAYEALTGRMAFGGRSVEDVLRGLVSGEVPTGSLTAGMPPMLRAFFERAFARDVSQRHASAREQAEALRHALGLDLPLSA